MWKWKVKILRNVGFIRKGFVITSQEGWDEEWKARANITARMWTLPPDIPGRQPGDEITDIEVAWVQDDQQKG